MLQIVKSIEKLSYSQIMAVYEETNKYSGATDYPRQSKNLQLLFAEQDLYAYLQDFFHTPEAFIALWCVDGCYKAALRMEPYLDGFLVAGLETMPSERGKGYAKALLKGALSALREQCPHPVYSHIAHKNGASAAVHRFCGFTCIREDAVYIDGVHHKDASTWVWK